MTPPGLLPLTLLAALAMAWWVNLRARAAALGRCRRVCTRRGVTLLDDTVALERYYLVRDVAGRRRLGRVYRFEFNGPEQERGRGWVRLIGPTVVAVALERADGGTDVEHPDTQ